MPLFGGKEMGEYISSKVSDILHYVSSFYDKGAGKLAVGDGRL